MTILLRGIVGSTAYGLERPGSDVDRLGVFAAPTEHFHGLNPPIGKAATIVRTKPDLTLHEAAKFASLALAGNPTASELMWLPDELYEVRTGLGDELIAIRTAFLSAPRVRDAYLGYATSQLRRSLRAGPVRAEKRQRSAKHGRHLLRLLDQGFALYSTGPLPIRLPDPERYLEFGRRVAGDPEAARPVLAAARARFDSVRSPLPDQPDEATVERWLLRVRRAELRERYDIMPR